MDALALLSRLPDASVNLIATDPPYNGVKDDAWDNQWRDDDHFIAWIGTLCQEWRRVLTPNGSLYVFASPRLAARVEVEIGRWFNVLNRITWSKPKFSTKAEMFDKDTMRAYFPASEAIIFAEQRGADGSNPVGKTIQEARLSVGLKGTDVDVALGYVRSKDETRGTELCRRWEEGSSLPSRDDFIRVMQLCKKDMNYDDLRREYDDLRRPFNSHPFAPYTDVWDFPTVQAYAGKHPAEKPLAMMEHIVNISSRPGDTVLDCFCGSGTTIDAARRNGRRYIGGDFDAHWVEYARHRVSLNYDVLLPLGVMA